MNPEFKLLDNQNEMSLEYKNIKLNEMQQKAYDAMASGKNVFLTSGAGAGKSFVIEHFKQRYQYKMNIGLTSTTGISALNIGGKTLHSFLGIALGKGSVKQLVEIICDNFKLKKRWKELHTLIIDEVSMLHPDLFDKLEEMARIIRISDKPFGGIQLILSGDLLQLPVIGTDKLCIEAKSWESCNFKIVYLTDIIRQTDKKFQKCLNEIRINSLSEESKDILLELTDKELEPVNGVKPTLICTTNQSVDEINKQELLNLNEEGVEYYTYDMDIFVYEKNVKASERQKIIDLYKKNCTGDEQVVLCVGAQVMLLVNLDTENGLVNGSRGVVIKFIEGVPVVRFLNGMEKIIDCHTWLFTDNHLNELVDITQVPLKLAWCITIHKTQGMTLDYAIVDCDRVFTFSQIYVALSRCRTLGGLSIKNLKLKSISCHPKALEFYKNLLKDEI